MSSNEGLLAFVTLALPEFARVAESEAIEVALFRAAARDRKLLLAVKLEFQGHNFEKAACDFTLYGGV